MYKVAWIARFHPGLTKEEGHRHWSDVHGPLCAEVPGLERYVQNHVVGGLPLVAGVPRRSRSSTATRAAGGPTARHSRRRCARRSGPPSSTTDTTCWTRTCSGA